MTATLTKKPKFHSMQWVRFVGGEGIVRDYKFNTGTWTYLVEMPLGLEPDFGRVGAQMMVSLNEADLRATRSLNEVDSRAA
ncbi:hypothetical protein IFO70_36570 [Phormidium tenue FACHB-886]|nr:hypothetical protein [Phormidium tenue FACHB-886]